MGHGSHDCSLRHTGIVNAAPEYFRPAPGMCGRSLSENLLPPRWSCGWKWTPVAFGGFRRSELAICRGLGKAGDVPVQRPAVFRNKGTGTGTVRHVAINRRGKQSPARVLFGLDSAPGKPQEWTRPKAKQTQTQKPTQTAAVDA